MEEPTTHGILMVGIDGRFNSHNVSHGVVPETAAVVAALTSTEEAR